MKYYIKEKINTREVVNLLNSIGLSWRFETEDYFEKNYIFPVERNFLKVSRNYIHINTEDLDETLEDNLRDTLNHILYMLEKEENNE